jgi:hypothetical protein
MPSRIDGAGQLIVEMAKPKGAAYKGNPGKSKNARSPESTTQKTLADIGITKDQSSQWQQLAGIKPPAHAEILRRLFRGSAMPLRLSEGWRVTVKLRTWNSTVVLCLLSSHTGLWRLS